jgi:hypothetical protein
MRKLLSTFVQKWPEYLLEILVITIGILGAFTLNNWNEKSKEKQKEKDYIIRFIQDLKRDTSNFAIELRNAEDKYLKAREAFVFITEDAYIIQDTTTFLINLQDIGRTNKPRIHQNTYNDLVSTGTSSLITDKNVLDAILTYYSTIPTEWYNEEYFDRMWKGYLPQAVKALDLDLLESILNQDSTAAEITKISYDIAVVHGRANEMLKKFKNIPDIEFQTKQITRTHLVHKYILNKTNTGAIQLVDKLENYLAQLERR